MTNQKLIRKIVANALLAAVYFAVTLLCSPFAYGAIQFRISEVLIFLCFFRPDLIWGITLGTVLANIGSISMFGPWDMLFGGLATLVAAIGVAYLSPRLYVAVLWPVAVNAFVIAAELYFISGIDYWYSVLTVGGGELAVLAVGYVLMLYLIRRKAFMDSIEATRHLAIRW